MFISSNFAISLDGKIATASREQFPLGTPEDLKQMINLRRVSQAILMGATTLRTYRKLCRVKGMDPQPFNVILSHSLEGVEPNWPFFQAPEGRRILFISRALKAEFQKAFEATSKVILLDPLSKTSITRQILSHLEREGVKHLLVEGGGSVMWDFVSENLIDEYNVTMTPRILGGSDAPTMVEGKGFAPDQVLNLKLKESRVVGNEIYMVYSKTESRGRDLPSA